MLKLKSEGPVFVGAHVAQLVEHVLGKDEVTGSIPVVSSTFVVLIAISNK